MSALDLSAFEAKVDSPELAAYKAKVKEIAETYTKRHGWCAEVKRALKEIGISEEKPVNINVTTTMGFVLQTDIKPSALIGKSEEEQKEIVARKIGNLSLTKGGGGTAMLVITPKLIESMELTDTPVVPDGRTLMQNSLGTNRWVWRRIRDGRVLHLFAMSGRGVMEIHSQSDFVGSAHLIGDSVCNRVSVGYGATVRNWSEDEEALEPCRTCETRATNLGLVPYVREPESAEVQ